VNCWNAGSKLRQASVAAFDDADANVAADIPRIPSKRGRAWPLHLTDRLEIAMPPL
jgi:hypothetical protein